MTDDGGRRLEFAPRARRDLKRLDPPIQRRIRALAGTFVPAELLPGMS